MPKASYPKLDVPEETGDHEIRKFRLSEITKIQSELEKDLGSYSRTKRKYSSVFNAATYMNGGSSALGALSAGGSVGLLASGVGVPMALPLGVLSLTLGAFSIVISAFNKKIKAKLEKHTAVVQLILAKLQSFRLLTNKALQDSQISDEEFNRLQADYNDYKMQKYELQRKSKVVFSQPVDAEVIKKEYEKKINETLKSVFGK